MSSVRWRVLRARETPVSQFTGPWCRFLTQGPVGRNFAPDHFSQRMRVLQPHCESRLARILRIGTVGCLLAGSSALPARMSAQASETEEAQAYINSHADIEDMVMVPMRDSVRLYHLILFPKGQPRQNLPTVMIRSPT